MTLTTTASAGETLASPKRLARVAGVFYLLVGISGGFAEGPTARPSVAELAPVPA